jgi:hypothetical protein
MTRTSRSAGFSIAELAVASTIFLGMVLLVSTLALSGSEAQDLGRRISHMTEMAQEATDRIRLEMISSVHVFCDDTDGNANVAAIDLGTSPPPIAVRRLPKLEVDGSFRADTAGDEITGNALLFAHLAWRDRFRCASGNEYLVDVYRWSHYYLSPKDGGPRPRQRGGLDLVHFVGEPLVDATAIDHITDPVDHAEVLQHLLNRTPDIDGQVHPAAQVVWLRGGDPTATGTFRQIEADGTLGDNPGAGRPNPWRVLSAGDRTAGLLAYRRGSVASNYDIVAPGVTRFAVRDDAAGFPHGFEVQFIGQTSARQLLLHLVMVDMTRKGPLAWSQVQTVINCKDR